MSISPKEVTKVTLVDKGLLERSGRGVYIIPTVFDDEMFTAPVLPSNSL